MTQETYEERRDRATKERQAIDCILVEGSFCHLCGHNDPFDIEEHHVALRKNDPLTVPLCRNCHGKMSAKQRVWPKVEELTAEVREGYLLLGLSDLVFAVSIALRECAMRRLKGGKKPGCDNS